MKKILNNISLILGFILLLGGFLLYAINKYGYHASLLPILIVFIFCQKFFVTGLTARSING